MFMSDFGEFFDWGDVTKDIGDLGHCHDFGFWGDGLLKVLGGESSFFCERDELSDRTGHLADLVPRKNV